MNKYNSQAQRYEKQQISLNINDIATSTILFQTTENNYHGKDVGDNEIKINYKIKYVMKWNLSCTEDRPAQRRDTRNTHLAPVV